LGEMIREKFQSGRGLQVKGFVLNRGCLSFVWVSAGIEGRTGRTGRQGTGNERLGIGRGTHPRRLSVSKERRVSVYHLVGVCYRDPHSSHNTDLSGFEAFRQRLCVAVAKRNPSIAEVPIDNGKPFSAKRLTGR